MCNGGKDAAYIVDPPAQRPGPPARIAPHLPGADHPDLSRSVPIGHPAASLNRWRRLVAAPSFSSYRRIHTIAGLPDRVGRRRPLS